MGASAFFGQPALQSLMNIVKPKISALGCYVPTGVLTNADLERMVQTSDDWIMSRVGIRERHKAAPDQATSDLAVQAARAALAQRGMDASELDAMPDCDAVLEGQLP